MLMQLLLNNLLKHSDKFETTIKDFGVESMNKTQRVIALFFAISNARNRTLHYDQVMPILSKKDDPLTDSNALRLLQELLEGMGAMPPILVKLGEGDKNKCSYKLNSEVWENFVYATNEGRFYFEAFKQLGQMIESSDLEAHYDEIEEDGSIIPNLSRKFMYLSKVQAHEFNEKVKSVVDDIVKCLIDDKLMQIYYCEAGTIESKWREVKPLTLCQYRDDLYLLCQKVQNNKWEFRTYKISRISEVEILDKKFTYPDLKEWNPTERYRDASGLVLGEAKECTVRVWGYSRQVFEEKLFFNSQRIHWHEEYCDYELKYTGLNEFVGQLFVYAQDVEILDGEEVKAEFTKKAQSALERNHFEVKLKKVS